MHAEKAVSGIVPGDEAGWSVRIGRWEIIGRLLVEGACTSFVGQKKLRGEVSQLRDLPQERCGLPVDVLFEHLLAGILGEKQERRGPAGQIESVSRFSFLEGGEVGNYVNLRRVGPLSCFLSSWRHAGVRTGQSRLMAADLSPEISFLELDLKWVC